jgi:hypothetical protein
MNFLNNFLANVRSGADGQEVLKWSNVIGKPRCILLVGAPAHLFRGNIQGALNVQEILFGK